jgi:hypothetical protein
MDNFRKVFQGNLFGSLLLILEVFSPGQADPNLTFNNSACFSIMEQTSLISSVITFPPKGITAV